jgi:putative endonuclease
VRQTGRSLGSEGEDRAAAHLEAHGYRILDRNVRAGGVEIDLVVHRGRLVVFVEVKARRGRGFGGALGAVDERKRARLVAGAHAWLRERRHAFTRARFDVVGWQVDADDAWQIQHVEGAFDASSD